MLARVILCALGALLIHAALMLFGGALFMQDESEAGSRRDVELVAEDLEKDRADEKQVQDPVDRVEAPPDAPPDTAPSDAPMDAPAGAEEDAPGLDAASLSAIEAALSGAGGGGDDFGGGGRASLASGGRIGGTGRAAEAEREVQGAFSMSEIDQRPRPVYQTPANYPAALRSRAVEGAVTLIFVVDDAGRVTSPRVEKSTHPEFEAPALDALRQWRFEPAVKGGKRVPCRMRVSIRFQPK